MTDQQPTIEIDPCPTCGELVEAVYSGPANGEHSAQPCGHHVHVTMHPDRVELATTAPELPASQWPEETVEQIRLAETAAQRSVCRIPEGDLPDELAKALERRVEVNLAQYDGGDILRVGSKDPEVRELEAPFARRRAAGSIDHRTQEGQS